MAVSIKRIYAPVAAADGFRILIDRLWPRGMKKQDASVDVWLKEVAPSTALRKWFDHDPHKWEQFKKKYLTELRGSAALKELISLAHKHKTLTLLFAAKEETYNHAVILQQYLKEHAGK